MSVNNNDSAYQQPINQTIIINNYNSISVNNNDNISNNFATNINNLYINQRENSPDNSVFKSNLRDLYNIDPTRIDQSQEKKLLEYVTYFKNITKKTKYQLKVLDSGLLYKFLIPLLYYNKCLSINIEAASIIVNLSKNKNHHFKFIPEDVVFKDLFNLVLKHMSTGVVNYMLRIILYLIENKDYLEKLTINMYNVTKNINNDNNNNNNNINNNNNTINNSDFYNNNVLNRLKKQNNKNIYVENNFINNINDTNNNTHNKSEKTINIKAMYNLNAEKSNNIEGKLDSCLNMIIIAKVFSEKILDNLSDNDKLLLLNILLNLYNFDNSLMQVESIEPICRCLGTKNDEIILVALKILYMYSCPGIKVIDSQGNFINTLLYNSDSHKYNNKSSSNNKINKKNALNTNNKQNIINNFNNNSNIDYLTKKYHDELIKTNFIFKIVRVYKKSVNEIDSVLLLIVYRLFKNPNLFELLFANNVNLILENYLNSFDTEESDEVINTIFSIYKEILRINPSKIQSLQKKLFEKALYLSQKNMKKEQFVFNCLTMVEEIVKLNIDNKPNIGNNFTCSTLTKELATNFKRNNKHKHNISHNNESKINTNNINNIDKYENITNNQTKNSNNNDLFNQDILNNKTMKNIFEQIPVFFKSSNKEILLYSLTIFEAVLKEKLQFFSENYVLAEDRNYSIKNMIYLLISTINENFTHSKIVENCFNICKHLSELQSLQQYFIEEPHVTILRVYCDDLILTKQELLQRQKEEEKLYKPLINGDSISEFNKNYKMKMILNNNFNFRKTSVIAKKFNISSKINFNKIQNLNNSNNGFNNKKQISEFQNLNENNKNKSKAKNNINVNTKNNNFKQDLFNINKSNESKNKDEHDDHNNQISIYKAKKEMSFMIYEIEKQIQMALRLIENLVKNSENLEVLMNKGFLEIMNKLLEFPNSDIINTVATCIQGFCCSINSVNVILSYKMIEKIINSLNFSNKPIKLSKLETLLINIRNILESNIKIQRQFILFNGMSKIMKELLKNDDRINNFILKIVYVISCNINKLYIIDVNENRENIMNNYNYNNYAQEINDNYYTKKNNFDKNAIINNLSILNIVNKNSENSPNKNNNINNNKENTLYEKFTNQLSQTEFMDKFLSIGLSTSSSMHTYKEFLKILINLYLNRYYLTYFNSDENFDKITSIIKTILSILENNYNNRPDIIKLILIFFKFISEEENLIKKFLHSNIIFAMLNLVCDASLSLSLNVEDKEKIYYNISLVILRLTEFEGNSIIDKFKEIDQKLFGYIINLFTNNSINGKVYIISIVKNIMYEKSDFFEEEKILEFVELIIDSKIQILIYEFVELLKILVQNRNLCKKMEKVFKYLISEINSLVHKENFKKNILELILCLSYENSNIKNFSLNSLLKLIKNLNLKLNKKTTLLILMNFSSVPSNFNYLINGLKGKSDIHEYSSSLNKNNIVSKSSNFDLINQDIDNTNDAPVTIPKKNIEEIVDHLIDSDAFSQVLIQRFLINITSIEHIDLSFISDKVFSTLIEVILISDKIQDNLLICALSILVNITNRTNNNLDYKLNQDGNKKKYNDKTQNLSQKLYLKKSNSTKPLKLVKMNKLNNKFDLIMSDVSVTSLDTETKDRNNKKNLINKDKQIKFNKFDNIIYSKNTNNSEKNNINNKKLYIKINSKRFRSSSPKKSNIDNKSNKLILQQFFKTNINENYISNNEEKQDKYAKSINNSYTSKNNKYNENKLIDSKNSNNKSMLSKLSESEISEYIISKLENIEKIFYNLLKRNNLDIVSLSIMLACNLSKYLSINNSFSDEEISKNIENYFLVNFDKNVFLLESGKFFLISIIKYCIFISYNEKKVMLHKSFYEHILNMFMEKDNRVVNLNLSKEDFICGNSVNYILIESHLKFLNITIELNHKLNLFTKNTFSNIFEFYNNFLKNFTFILNEFSFNILCIRNRSKTSSKALVNSYSNINKNKNNSNNLSNITNNKDNDNLSIIHNSNLQDLIISIIHILITFMKQEDFKYSTVESYMSTLIFKLISTDPINFSEELKNIFIYFLYILINNNYDSQDLILKEELIYWIMQLFRLSTNTLQTDYFCLKLFLKSMKKQDEKISSFIWKSSKFLKKLYRYIACNCIINSHNNTTKSDNISSNKHDKSVDNKDLNNSKSNIDTKNKDSSTININNNIQDKEKCTSNNKFKKRLIIKKESEKILNIISFNHKSHERLFEIGIYEYFKNNILSKYNPTLNSNSNYIKEDFIFIVNIFLNRSNQDNISKDMGSILPIIFSSKELSTSYKSQLFEIYLSMSIKSEKYFQEDYLTMFNILHKNLKHNFYDIIYLLSVYMDKYELFSKSIIYSNSNKIEEIFDDYLCHDNLSINNKSVVSNINNKEETDAININKYKNSNINLIVNFPNDINEFTMFNKIVNMFIELNPRDISLGNIIRKLLSIISKNKIKLTNINFIQIIVDLSFKFYKYYFKINEDKNNNENSENEENSKCKNSFIPKEKEIVDFVAKFNYNELINAIISYNLSKEYYINIFYFIQELFKSNESSSIVKGLYNGLLYKKEFIYCFYYKDVFSYSNLDIRELVFVMNTAYTLNSFKQFDFLDDLINQFIDIYNKTIILTKESCLVNSKNETAIETEELLSSIFFVLDIAVNSKITFFAFKIISKFLLDIIICESIPLEFKEIIVKYYQQILNLIKITDKEELTLLSNQINNIHNIDNLSFIESLIIGSIIVNSNKTLIVNKIDMYLNMLSLLVEKYEKNKIMDFLEYFNQIYLSVISEDQYNMIKKLKLYLMNSLKVYDKEIKNDLNFKKKLEKIAKKLSSY